MSTALEAAVLNRMIRPDAGDLPPEAARFLLSLDFSNEDHARIDALSARAQEGTLSDEERQDLEGYIRLGDMLALLQSKARRSLKRSDSSAA